MKLKTILSSAIFITIATSSAFGIEPGRKPKKRTAYHPENYQEVPTEHVDMEKYDPKKDYSHMKNIPVGTILTIKGRKLRDFQELKTVKVDKNSTKQVLRKERESIFDIEENGRLSENTLDENEKSNLFQIKVFGILPPGETLKCAVKEVDTKKENKAVPMIALALGAPCDIRLWFYGGSTLPTNNLTVSKFKQVAGGYIDLDIEYEQRVPSHVQDEGREIQQKSSAPSVPSAHCSNDCSHGRTGKSH